VFAWGEGIDDLTIPSVGAVPVEVMSQVQWGLGRARTDNETQVGLFNGAHVLQ